MCVLLPNCKNNINTNDGQYLGTSSSYHVDDMATLYSKNMSFIYLRLSFSISNYSLQGREQLDFSRASSDPTVVQDLKQYGDGCEFFLRSYWPRDSPRKLEMIRMHQ
jgi:hypothetical protein